jgi:exonuclease V gamma subunit
MKNAQTTTSSLSFSMSNDIEWLLEKLKSQLYLPCHKFTRKLLVTACDNVKTKIEKNLNKEIFFGLRHINLHLAMQELLKALCPGVRFPNPVQMTILIEAEIRKEIETRNPLFEDIFDCADVAKLSDHLGGLFFEYSLYDQKIDGWQGEVFQRVFLNFDLPSKVFSKSSFEKKIGKWQVFFFGVQSIPDLYLNFLEKISDQIEVHFYLFSYSSQYWGDCLSNKERLKAKNSEEIEDYLDMDNSLFSNLCPFSRSFFNCIIDRGYCVEEHYKEPKSKTLLGKIQSDIFHLVNPLDIVSLDSSIEVLESSSMLREVEAVRDKILYKMESEALSFDDIVILAPDITVYAPFIEYAFKAQIGFSIQGVKNREEEGVLSVLEKILGLFDSRWEVHEIIEIVENSIIQRKLGIESSDAAKFIWALEKTQMVWGFNEMHRQQFIPSESLITGTLQNSFNKMLLALCVTDVDSLDPIFYTPIELDMPFALSLGKIIDFFTTLYKDIQDAKNKRGSLEDHFANLSRILILSYDCEEFSVLLAKMFQSLHFLKKIELPFSSLIPHVRRLLAKKKGVLKSKEPNRIRCASLDLGEAYCYKLIICMGMSQSSFPRLSSFSPFDLLKISRPSLQRIDRYIFLEIIMSVQKGLIFSYSKQSGEELSYLVSDLLGYIANCTSITKLDLVQVVSDFNLSIDSLSYCYSPLFHTIADKYYKKESIHKKVQELANGTASARDLNRDLSRFSSPKPIVDRLGREKFKDQDDGAASCQLLNHFVYIQFKTDSIIQKPEELCIDMAVLFRAVKNPLQYFCLDSLGFSLKKERQEELFEKEFVVSPLDQGLLRHKWAASLNEISKLQYLTSAPFFSALHKEHATLHLDEQFELLEENLKVFGLKKQDLFSIHFTSLGTGVNERRPILLPSGVKITGVLPYVTSKGLIAIQKSKFEGLYSIWPQILIYNLLDFPKELFLLREGKKISIDIDNPEEALENLVSFLKLIKNNPVPCLPNLAENFLATNFKGLFASFRELEDPYFRWLFTNEIEGISEAELSGMVSKIKPLWAPFLNWMEKVHD